MSEVNDAVNTAADQLEKEIVSKLQAEGASSALERVSAILALSDKPQFQALLKECAADSQCSIADATLKLGNAMMAHADEVKAKAQEDADSQVVQAKKDASNAIRDSIVAAPGVEPDKLKSEWNADADLRASYKDDFDLYKESLELIASGNVRNSSNLRRVA